MKFIRPYYALHIFLMICWPRFFYMNFAGKGVNPYTIANIISLTLSIMLVFSIKKFKDGFYEAIKQSWYIFFIEIIYFIWKLSCDISGFSSMDSIGKTLQDFLYFESWLLISCIMLLDDRIRAHLPNILLASAAFVTLFGVIEWITHRTFSDTFGISEVQAGDAGHLSNMNLIGMRNGELRVKSLFSHPLVYGQFMAALTPVALQFFLRGGALNIIKASIFLLCIVFSVYVCNSRSPFLMIATAGVVFGCLHLLDFRKGGKLFTLLSTILGVMLFSPIISEIALGYLTGRSAQEAMSTSARDLQLTRGISALYFKPAMGYGDGAAINIAGIVGEHGALSIDNEFLSLAVDFGYVGVALFIMLIAAIMGKGLAQAIATQHPTDRLMFNCAVASMASIMLGLTILSIVDETTVLYLMGGLIIALDAQRHLRARMWRQVRTPLPAT